VEKDFVFIGGSPFVKQTRRSRERADSKVKALPGAGKIVVSASLTNAAVAWASPRRIEERDFSARCVTM
jgi:hypothetical protein